MPVRLLAVTGFASFLLTAAVTLVAPRLSAWTESAGDRVAVENTTLRVEPGRASGDSRVAIRETFGTTVGFVGSRAEAERVAAQERKLTFLLHVSGNFDDPGLT